MGVFLFLTCGGAIVSDGEEFSSFLPERKVVFVSVTTLSLFGVLSYIFTGIPVGAPYEFLLFAGVGLLVGVFALIKRYLKDRGFRDN